MKTHDPIGIFLTLLSLLGPLLPNPMHIKLFLLPLFFCFIQAIGAQTTVSRVTFPIDEKQTTSDLAKAGIDLSHGHGKLGSFFTTEAFDYELAMFDEMGIRYTIDIPDLSKHRKEANEAFRGGGLLECQDDVNNAEIPQNFELGSIGGFFSLPDILDQLDLMNFYYPDLISIRKPIGSYKTRENNSIFWVRISDHPETDEDEPEVLYTSLLHAREFVSISQNIFFMWHLLENYHKDPMIKQILDHTELYFVPVVNPDGLNYNVQGYDPVENEFNTFQRKNLRDNDEDGEFDPKYDGVDLNRNFGAFWGYDDIGSSPNPSSQTYRGPYPFSEPETQAIRDLCNAHDFKIALNFHSYGNLLIYPWGYSDKHTHDSTSFINYGQLMTRTNRFVFGLGSQTVGYVTNGDSDDWMYDAHGTFAMTPEVGQSDDDFYPLRERIIPLCKSTLPLNIVAARLVNSLIDISDESPAYIQPGNNTLNLEFTRHGLLDGEVIVSFNPVTSNVIEVPEAITFQLDKFENHERNLNFVIDQNIPYGSPVKIEIVCSQGEYTFRDTITKLRADFFVLVEDHGDLSHWDISEGPGWGVTDASYKSGPRSITDSPSGDYGPDVNEIILLNETIDLRDVTEAYAQFWAKWNIEDEYDYVVFQASVDGVNWDNLCGEWSKLGGVFQLYEEPLYDGKQLQWVLETSDLNVYLGEQIQLRFMIVSDGFVAKDGFYFDDFKVLTIKEETTSSNDVNETGFLVYPNPSDNNFMIEMPEFEKGSVTIYNSLGQPVYEEKSIHGTSHEVLTTSWPEGLYHYIICSDNVPVYNGTVSLVH